jgi:hypothetical protein
VPSKSRAFASQSRPSAGAGSAIKAGRRGGTTADRNRAR